MFNVANQKWRPATIIKTGRKLKSQRVGNLKVKNKMKKSIFSISIISVLLTSCATIFTGTKDKITFNSTPSGATIYKDGVEQCKTPCTLRVTRSLNDTDIEYKLDGFETRLITLDKELNVVSILNLGNLLGWGIDALSGAIMKYDRKVYDITLSKNTKTSMIKPTKINFDTKRKVVELFVQAK
jgi:hypothetical protein